MVEALFRHRLIWLALLASALVAAAIGMARLRFDFSVYALMRSETEAFEDLERLNQGLGRLDNTVVVLVTAPDVLDRPVVDYLVELSDRLVTIDGIVEVHGLPHVAYVKPDGALPVSMRQAAAEGTLREVVRDHPLIRGRIVSEDGRATLLFVRIDSSRELYEDLLPVVRDLRQVLDEVPPPEATQAAAIGMPILRVSMVETMEREQSTFFPLLSLTWVVLLALAFRDPRSVVVPLSAVFFSIVLLLGAMGHAGEELNALNNIFPTLIFVIALSDGIHLLCRYREELRAGRPREAALRSMVGHVGVACLFTSLTTAIGFASLGAARLDILQRFGLWMALGILLAYLVSMIFLPLAFSFLRPVRFASAGDSGRSFADLSLKLCDWAMRRRRAVIAGAIGLAALAVGLGSRVEIEGRLMEWYGTEHPVYQLNQRIEQHFHGVLPFALVMEWDEGVDPLQPEILSYLADLSQELEQDPRLGVSLSLSDLVAEWSLMHQRGRGERRVPEDPELLRDAIAQLEFVFGAGGGLLGQVYDADARLMRISGWVPDLGFEELEDLFQDLEARLAADADRHQRWGVRMIVGGDTPVANVAISRLIREIFNSLLLAFVFIFLAMAALLRSIRLALVSMVPNVLPLLFTLGFMGVAGIELNLTTVTVFCISLGLAVDDTIHFMVRYREEGRRHSDPHHAIRQTCHGTGQAIFLTTGVLAVGFAALLFSQSPLTRSFALCMEVTILSALVADLVLLPACLRMVPGARSKASSDPAPSTARG